MAVYTYLTPAADTPLGLAISLSPGGGGSAATLSFLLVAWDDPDEKDISRARFFNSMTGGNSLMTWGAVSAPTYISSIAKSIELNDIATLTWTAPHKLPHHYALYYQAAAVYDIANTGIKILPSSGMINGHIPGTATSLVLAARAAAATYYTAITWERFVLCAIDTTNHYVDIRGNWMGYFKTGTSTISEEQGITTRRVDAKALYYDSGGEYTRLTVQAGPTVGIKYVAVSVPATGLFCPTSVAASTCTVLFSPTRDVEHQKREIYATDYAGNSLTRSYANNSPDAMLVAHIDYTAVLVAPHGAAPRIDGGALFQVDKWMRTGVQLDYFVVESDLTMPHSADRWRVSVTDLNDPQHSSYSDKDEITLTMKPSSFTPAYQDYGGWRIITVTAGAATCVITGPYDRRLVAGARVWIINSTGNDGLWAISSVSVSGNTITLTLTTNLLDSTDDGYLVLEDMQ